MNRKNAERLVLFMGAAALALACYGFWVFVLWRP